MSDGTPAGENDNPPAMVIQGDGIIDDERDNP